MHQIIKIFQILLAGPKRELAQAGINVARIVEQYPAEIVSDQWKSQFHLVEKQRRAPQGEASGFVPWTGLIIGEAAGRSSAASEEPLRQRHFRSLLPSEVITENIAEIGAAGQHQAFTERMVRGIPGQDAQKIDLGAENPVGQSE